MAELPTGTVTFLFTDIEGSTRLLQELGERYAAVQEEHHAIVRRAVAHGGGVEVSTEGDSFFVVFASPAGAVRAAVEVQRALAAHPWPQGDPLRVRIGLHTGEGAPRGGDYVGIDVNRAARIAGAAHGGQVIVSDSTRALVERGLPEGVSLRDLGEHRLKDLVRPERLHDLVIDGLPSEFPPPRTLSARPNNLPAQLTSFVGREQEIQEVPAGAAGGRGGPHRLRARLLLRGPVRGDRSGPGSRRGGRRPGGPGGGRTPHPRRREGPPPGPRAPPGGR